MAFWTWELPPSHFTHTFLKHNYMQFNFLSLSKETTDLPATPLRKPHLVYSLQNLQLPPQVWLASAPRRK